jgi:hypothetical protein
MYFPIHRELSGAFALRVLKHETGAREGEPEEESIPVTLPFQVCKTSYTSGTSVAR